MGTGRAPASRAPTASPTARLACHGRHAPTAARRVRLATTSLKNGRARQRRTVCARRCGGPATPSSTKPPHRPTPPTGSAKTHCMCHNSSSASSITAYSLASPGRSFAPRRGASHTGVLTTTSSSRSCQTTRHSSCACRNASNPSTTVQGSTSGSSNRTVRPPLQGRSAVGSAKWTHAKHKGCRRMTTSLVTGLSATRRPRPQQRRQRA